MHILHPELELVDCEICREWVCDPRTGQPREWMPGVLIPRGQTPPPCEADPPGRCELRDLDLERFTELNFEIYQRYMAAKVLGPTPEEAASLEFREACVLIADVEMRCNAVLAAWATWGRPDGNDS